MKWQSVSVSLMAMTLLAVGALLMQQWSILFKPIVFTPEYTGEDLQLGYYDLLFKHRELYNTRFYMRGKVVIMTLSNPNDNRSRLKIRIEQQKSYSQGVGFDCVPLFISSSNGENMLSNLLGYIPRKSALFDGFNFGKERIVVMPSGQIFSYRNNLISTLPSDCQHCDE